MKVAMLLGGWFTSAAGLWRRGDDMDRQVRFPVPVYLIENERERILVDTGLARAGVADPSRHYEGARAMDLFELEQEAPLAEQVDLDTITKVVLTHLHFDHVGGLSEVPVSAPVVVQRAEWEAGHNKAAVERNFYLPVDYADGDREVMLVEGDHDLLGDGSVELLFTPGHTPGHQSVRIGDSLVIGGDVTHYASGLDDRRFPIFAADFDAQDASAERLRRLRDAGADVRPGHDPDLLEPGPLAL